MIEQPPRFGSKRFRQILIPAFKADPATTLSGLYWFVTRRRVRGWSRLMVAASKAPLNYAVWTRQGEVRALAEYRRHHASRRSDFPVIVLLLDQDRGQLATADSTVRSIHAAVGRTAIYSVTGCGRGVQCLPRTDSLLGALSELARLHGTAWLLPIKAGDQVSGVLGEILSRSVGAQHEVLAYWDEDWLDGGQRRDPWVKPDWDPLLFSSLRGMLGASIMSLAAVESYAPFGEDHRINQEGVEQMLFHVASMKPPKHIPLILTHRAQQRQRRDNSPRMPQSPANWPAVSIIIPTRDKPELLAACLSGIDRTDYPGTVQIIVVDNGSREPAALELLGRIQNDSRVLLLRDEGPFNFSRLNNVAVAAADGELLCLLNNDVEPLDSDWLKALALYALADGVGAVGPQLLYPGGRIQHAGVVVGLGSAAGHVQKGVSPDEASFWTWHAVTREVSALTAAVLVLKRSNFDAVKGFDERFAVAFNDVDFCLRLKERGLRNIYVADVRLLHRESETRGKDHSPMRARRFASELALLKERWGTENYTDPHFSPLFSRLVERCVLAA